MSTATVTFLIASRNPGKTAEFRQLLDPAWTVVNVADFPELPEVEETGDTFEENAILKARTLSEIMGNVHVLADDSGLEVDALDGDPGVYSARYAGEGATDAENRAKLLQEMEEVEALAPSQRTARFRCILALAWQGAIIRTFRGTCEGEITRAEQGDGGFGYDSLFIPEGHSLTFAQLPAAEKNRISHRAQAMGKLLVHLKENPPRSVPVYVRTAVDDWIKALTK